MNLVRSLIWLTDSHLQRLLREGMVRRALGFPIVLVGVTLFLTLLTVGVLRGPSVVAVQAPLPPAAAKALADRGFVVRTVPDARAAVSGREAALGIGPETWYTSGSRDAVLAEQTIRRSRGAPWWPTPTALPDAAFGRRQGRGMARLVLAIYALYGVVFGAAMVARDRDQGTLEVELALPIPALLHGASRLVAATVVLAGWMALGVACLAAWIGVLDAPAVGRIGVAAALAAVSLGLGSVGRSGLQTGFATSLAAGLSAATALFGLGYALPSVGAHLPIASIVAESDGWTPLLSACVLAAGALFLFVTRTARP